VPRKPRGEKPAAVAPVWSTACLDWQERIVAGRSLIPFDPLFPDEAAAALAVFKELRIVDAPGSPTMGEACRPWIFDLVSAVCGAYDRENGRQLIREFFLSVSKKNFKSGLAAGLMQTLLIRNWRESAEFLILSPTIEIASNSFYPARDMVRKDEELSDLLHVQDHIRTITHRGNGSMLKVVAADSETVSGKKGTVVLVDEFWLFGKQPRAENMLREATGGLASRPEGCTIYLTTQSDEPPAGVFAQKLMYARGVRDGRITDNKFLPVLYEFPPGMIERNEHRDPKNFYVTNPNLRVSVDEEFLEHEFKKAEDAGEESIRGFMAKHLNVEIGLALMSQSWAGAVFWEMAGSNDLTLAEILKRCEVVTAGVDFGGVDDWLALALIGRDRLTGDWLHWAHAWAHPIAFERRKSEASRWHDFVRDGDLTIVEKVGQEVAAVIAIIMQCEESGLLERVGVDRYKIQDIFDGLVKSGLAADRIVAVDQGWKLVGAIATTERRLAAGTFHHGGSAMMAYCVGNAKVEAKGNNIIISKQIAGAAKIDPLMATFNAVSLMALNPEARSLEPTMLFFGGGRSTQPTNEARR
jgi:phage terminase large subunit-like protein